MATRNTSTTPKVATGVRRRVVPATAPVMAVASTESAFIEVVGLIQAARQRSAQAVNTELIDLYWRIGQFLHHRIEADGWAQIGRASCRERVCYVV